jgi:hypothetical protein
MVIKESKQEAVIRDLEYNTTQFQYCKLKKKFITFMPRASYYMLKRRNYKMGSAKNSKNES